MTLFSASEDLALRTLRYVYGSLNRLTYLAGLKDPSGNYHHWGIARVHSDEECNRAALEAHHEVVHEMLRKPISEMLLEVQRYGEADITPDAFSADMSRWMPQGSSKAAETHLKSVLHALSELTSSPGQTFDRPAA